MNLDDKFDHPCRGTCSGWQQGYEKGQEGLKACSSETERKAGWSDVLKILLTPEAKKYINEAFYCQVDFRDWVESQLHKLDEQLFKENA